MPRKYTDSEAREMLGRMRPDFLPSTPYPGATKKWKGIHSICGNVVSPRLNNLQQGEGCCLECSGKRPLTDEEARVLVRQYCPTFLPDPNILYKSRKTPWKGIHSLCGGSVSPYLEQLLCGKGCCRNCAKFGPKHDKPAILYLITHETQAVLKIGVAEDSSRNRRIRNYFRYGWELRWSEHLLRGQDAYDIELEILHRWRLSGLQVGISKELAEKILPSTGRTEVISLAEMSVDRTISMIDECRQRQVE